MWKFFKKLPLVISIPSIFILMMLIPALHGFYVGNEHHGRTFLYAVLLGIFSISFISLLIQNESLSTHRHTQIWSFLAFFIGFPILLAIPFQEVLVDGDIINSYLDIVSVVTTTALPVFPTDVLSETLVLWRVCMGWSSGFLIWVFAWSLFAQLNLGGFERLGVERAQSTFSFNKTSTWNDLPAEKFWHEAERLAPIYFWITACTSLLLLVASGDPFFSVLRAMSTIATFGIEIPGHTGAGWPGEAILILIMVFALSRSTFSNLLSKTSSWRFVDDPELRVAAILIVLAMLILTSLSWSAKIQIDIGLEAIWGIFFTSISYLTTTGLTSTYIPNKLSESGSGEIIFMALAMLGGGVATTAGGIKLLRVYILTRHCTAEIDRLMSPSQVKIGQGNNVFINYPNPTLACVFLILFILVFAAITLGLTLTGSSAGEALHLTLATLTNTGPLAQEFGNAESVILELGTKAKLLLVFAMVFGRLEVLALLALLNPEIYRYRTG